MASRLRHIGDVAVDPRDARIAELEGLVTALLARDAEREAVVARLEKRVAELEEKLGMSSRNSSKPPSSDPPTVTPKSKPATGRKPGGQPGHKGHRRAMFPPERVTEVVECKPTRCAGCDAKLRGTDPEPDVHQVAELPKIEPLVTEYRLHALSCRCCGRWTRGQLPEGTPRGAFGPRVVAMITELVGVYGVSRRDAQDMLRDMFSLPMSLGAVIGCQKLGASALAPAHAEALAEVPRAKVRYADETGWRVGNLYACLWVVVTPTVTVFRIQAERSRVAAMAILGKVTGLLGSDRYSVYDFWAAHRHQFCWAHLSRLFVKFSERTDPTAKAAGLALGKEKDAMFEAWQRVRDGTLKRESFTRKMLPIQRRVAALLDDGTRSACARTRRTCERLLQNTHSLWTFVYNDGIEPTNNIAERAIRRPVIVRKTSFGSHSEHGCRFQERVWTVHATLRQADRCVHDFITQACSAYMLGGPSPSLLRT
jgi:transposase